MVMKGDEIIAHAFTRLKNQIILDSIGHPHPHLLEGQQVPVRPSVLGFHLNILSLIIRCNGAALV